MAIKHQKAADSMFIGPIYENMREVQKVSGLYCDVVLRPSLRKGVLHCEVTCWRLSDQGDRVTPVRYEADYPHATTQSLDAFLYSATQRALLMAEQWGERRGEG